MSRPRDPLDALAEEFVERRRRGERVELEEYVERYPDLADSIREIFPALLMMEDLDPAGASGDGEDREAIACTESPRPERIGEYRIVREIGRGGMGIVYEAVQESLGRRVALKVLPAHRGVEAKSIERFRRESQAAARLQHANIVPVYAVGEEGAIFYYVMRYVVGGSLDEVIAELRKLRGGEIVRETTESRREARATLALELCSGRARSGSAASPGGEAENPEETPDGPESDRGPTSSNVASSTGILDSDSSGGSGWNYWRRVARIGLEAAHALEYAHEEGVIHRDVKPSNLLLDLDGHVWITDFGLAKLVRAGDEPLTISQERILGTVPYMAPEQFEGAADARTDIYGLGLTLYELVTLQRAFKGRTHQQIVKGIAGRKPISPRQIDPTIPRDLETIILKAIDRESGKRYQTARWLREDLERFLDNRPILARRVSALEHAWRWRKRNPVLAGVSVALVLCLTLGLAGITYAYFVLRETNEKLESQFRDLVAARRTAMQRLIEARLSEAFALRQGSGAGRRFQAVAALEEAAATAAELARLDVEMDDETSLRLRNEIVAAEGLIDVRPRESFSAAPFRNAYFAAMDPDFTHYVGGAEDGSIHVLRRSDRKLVRRFSPSRPGSTWGSNFAISRDARYVAGSLRHGALDDLRVWSLATGEVLLERQITLGSKSSLHAELPWIAFDTPEGKLMLHDLEAGATRLGIASALPPPRLVLLDSPGERLAVASQRSSTVEVRSTHDGSLLHRLEHRNGVYALAWSPDSSTLATASERTLSIWPMASGDDAPAPRSELDHHDNRIVRLAYSESGKFLFSSCWSHRLIIWDARSDEALLETHGEFHQVRSGDEELLVSPSRDRFEVWELARESFRVRVPVRRDWEQHVAFHPRERLTALSSMDGVRVVDADSGQTLLEIPERRVRDVKFIGERRLLMGSDRDGLVVRELTGATMLESTLASSTREILLEAPSDNRMTRFETCSRGETIVAMFAPAGRGHVVTRLLPDGGARTLSVEPKIPLMSLNPSGRWLALSAWHSEEARIVDTTSGAVVERHTSYMPHSEFSACGRWLALSSGNRCEVLSTESWEPVLRVSRTGMSSAPPPVSFDAQGTLLAHETKPGVVQLLEIPSGDVALEFSVSPGELLRDIVLSHDAARLAVVSRNELHLWSLDRLRERLRGLEPERDEGSR